jgi:RsiW-degrading membrane proteinase PrsW (M82 family)
MHVIMYPAFLGLLWLLQSMRPACAHRHRGDYSGLALTIHFNWNLTFDSAAADLLRA